MHRKFEYMSSIAVLYIFGRGKLMAGTAGQVKIDIVRNNKKIGKCLFYMDYYGFSMIITKVPGLPILEMSNSNRQAIVSLMECGKLEFGIACSKCHIRVYPESDH